MRAQLTVERILLRLVALFIRSSAIFRYILINKVFINLLSFSGVFKDADS